MEALFTGVTSIQYAVMKNMLGGYPNYVLPESCMSETIYAQMSLNSCHQMAKPWLCLASALVQHVFARQLNYQQAVGKMYSQPAR